MSTTKVTGIASANRGTSHAGSRSRTSIAISAARDSVISSAERPLQTFSVAIGADTVVALDDVEAKMNRVFENTGFTYKSALDKTVAVNPTLH